jgi:CDP-2,3-bis-(O-geranylgeranyl)-sn-glycerol synthase
MHKKDAADVVPVIKLMYHDLVIASRIRYMWDVLFIAVWLMLPVYMANNCATLFGGGRPLDGGRMFTDGKRILGDHKTVNGLVFGSLGGIVVGLLLAVAAPYVLPYFDRMLGLSFSGATLPIIIAMPIGALAGDSVKSFFKRRLGMREGSMLPVADQLDFVIGALVFGLITAPAWSAGNFTLPVVVTIVLMTFPLQLFHNMVAVALGKKKVLW